jgi:hypothetical protein
VAVVNRELADTSMRRDGLERIAKLTGGTCLAPKDLGKLESLLDTKPITTTVRSDRPLWDNWLVLTVLIGVLGMEWIVRRRNDLT